MDELTFFSIVMNAVLLFAIILILVMIRGPALVFLMAKLRSKIVLIQIGRDKIANVVTATYNQGSLRPTGKGTGYFITANNSIFPTRAGRVPLAVCYDQLATTADPRFLLAMKELERLRSQPSI